MDIIKTELSKLLSTQINKIFSININNIEILNPPKKELGDFCIGCFSISKINKQDIKSIGEKLLESLKTDFIYDLNISGPYLNFRVFKKFYTDIFINNNFLNLDIIGNNKTIVIDYIGANVGKTLHIGHMCTPNLGQVYVNLYKKFGYNVISDSHIGDWGIIFGKLIYAYKLWGDEKELSNNAVEHLHKLYIKITSLLEEKPELEDEVRNEFKLLSNGEKESIIIWEKFTKSSIFSMQKQLDRIGVKSDFNIGESFYEGLNLPKIENYPDLKYNMSDIVSELVEKNIATKNQDGSIGVVFDENEKIPSCILQKRDGTHGYLASDLCALKYRMINFSPEKIIYFVDIRQKLHLQQVFSIGKKAGWIGNTQLYHAENGFVSLKEGAMSSRKGNIIKLSDLLDESIDRAKKIILQKREDFDELKLNEISEIVGIGAIKYGYLSKSRLTDIVFDWDDFITFEGNSGPYIQYNYVRAIKILSKSSIDIEKVNLENSIFDHQEEIELFKDISKYREVLTSSLEDFFPHNIVTYLYYLTKKFSSFYNNVEILSEKDYSKIIIRLKLVKIYSQIVENLFEILSIKLPKEM